MGIYDKTPKLNDVKTSIPLVLSPLIDAKFKPPFL